jgi:hypothetical protein
LCGDQSDESANRDFQARRPAGIRPYVSRPSRIVEAEFIELRGNDALCWFDVADDLRVFGKIPVASVQKLKLSPGDIFLWNPDTKIAAHRDPPQVDSIERKELATTISDLKSQLRVLRARTDES